MIAKAQKQEGNFLQNSFPRGVHPGDRKALTKDKPIVPMPAPAVVYIPLVQHLGKPALPVVKERQKVAMGELIAKADGALSGNIHSSVSGHVRGVETLPTHTGSAAHIVVENDWLYTEKRLRPLKNPKPADILERVETAGIVGLGGAGFPVAVKLRPKTAVDTLIINAAECEPYITCDYRILLEYTARFVSGCRLLMRALSLENGIIGIEDNKRDAAAVVEAYIKDENISDLSVRALPAKYPQGAEKQLIFAVTGRVVPSGDLPADAGVIVHNAHTALAVHDAVCEGIPLYRRVMTVSGEGVKQPGNFLAPVGATLNDALIFAGGLDDRKRVVKMLWGGPMMGFALSGGGVSITKTAGCLLLLTEAEAETASPTACINCGRCHRACPMRLMPMYIDKYIFMDDAAAAVRYGAKHCIECGACAYVCPAKRTLVQSIRLAKKQIRERGL
ncbi:MAG: electron transport complex subunit RsxC [Clostridiales bacterium]|jgi:electron transport complex protein RnfC|nr:electron transport complex subunit RsxC [Clostridiales bacterium]